MDSYLNLVLDLVAKYPKIGSILVGVGSLVFLMSVIVKLTPSKSDDAFMEQLKAMPIVGKLVAFLESFSIFQRKDK